MLNVVLNPSGTKLKLYENGRPNAIGYVVGIPQVCRSDREPNAVYGTPEWIKEINYIATSKFDQSEVDSAQSAIGPDRVSNHSSSVPGCGHVSKNVKVNRIDMHGGNKTEVSYRVGQIEEFYALVVKGKPRKDKFQAKEIWISPSPWEESLEEFREAKARPRPKSDCS